MNIIDFLQNNLVDGVLRGVALCSMILTIIKYFYSKRTKYDALRTSYYEELGKSDSLEKSTKFCVNERLDQIKYYKAVQSWSNKYKRNLISKLILFSKFEIGLPTFKGSDSFLFYENRKLVVKMSSLFIFDIVSMFAFSILLAFYSKSYFDEIDAHDDVTIKILALCIGAFSAAWVMIIIIKQSIKIKNFYTISKVVKQYYEKID